MKKYIALTAAIISLLAYPAQAGQEQLAKSIRLAREEATATSEQLASALNALNMLACQKEGDLAPAYQAFKTEVPKTQRAADATNARVQAMTNERESYFADWQKTINSINNPSLQKKAQKRLNAASQSYDKVSASLVTAAEKFRPFLSDLADVEKALSQDVTARGVKNVKGVVRQANFDHKFVSSAVNAALKEMQKMEKALSTQAD